MFNRKIAKLTLMASSLCFLMGASYVPIRAPMDSRDIEGMSPRAQKEAIERKQMERVQPTEREGMSPRAHKEAMEQKQMDRMQQAEKREAASKKSPQKMEDHYKKIEEKARLKASHQKIEELPRY